MICCCRIEVFIDDEWVGSTELPLSSPIIEGMLGSQGGLYIGGIPEATQADNMAASLEPLYGCITDIIINSEYVLFLIAFLCAKFNVISILTAMIHVLCNK